MHVVSSLKLQCEMFKGRDIMTAEIDCTSRLDFTALYTSVALHLIRHNLEIFVSSFQ